MRCFQCQDEHLPYEAVCPTCGAIMLSDEKALEQRARWDALAETTRGEIRESVEKQRRLFREYRQYLKESRLRHTVYGAALAGGLCMISYIPLWGSMFMFLHALPDMFLGACAGFLVNRLRGGTYNGLFCFGGAFVVALMIKEILTIGMLGIVTTSSGGNPAGGFIVAIVAGHLLLVEIGGYLFGMQLTFEHESWHIWVTNKPPETGE